MTGINPCDDLEYDEEMDRRAEELFEDENQIKLRLSDSQCKKSATNKNSNKKNHGNKTK